jgi:acetyltransferase-like isoleucine patch superfamily enzyme
MLSFITLKIKRKDSPFYAFLYKLAKQIRSFSFPCIKVIHLPLYYLDYAFKVSIRHTVSMVWSVPLFRARCERVGRNLRLPNGIPLIVGGHLKIELGDDVTIRRSTIGASKLFDCPVFRVGSGSTVGYGTNISVAKEISIGERCLIGPNCYIMDNDDHPISPKKRLAGEGVGPEDVRPVRIGNNVWLGNNCLILKGVTVGDNSVIAAHSVITKDVLPNAIYAGFPARPTQRDIDIL